MSPDCVDGKSMLSDLIDYAKEHGIVNEIEESADTVDDDIDYDEEGGDEDIFAGFKNFEYSDPDPDYDYVKARIFNSLLLKRLERGKIDRETYHKACESTYMDNPKLNYLKWLR